MELAHINFENDRLVILDQTLLPGKVEYINLDSLDSSIEAIKSLRVRGAPAIGITAAYALFIEAKRLYENGSLTYNNLFPLSEKLKHSRPTAVNLEWATNRMMAHCKNNSHSDMELLLESLRLMALQIHNEDRQTCDKIGQYGAALLDDQMSVLTHCNAGILATGGTGTALAPIYKATEQGKKIHVFVDETRPLGQGARLTYWELKKMGVPATLISDNMAGTLMQQNKIGMIIVGADRIAANGDIANKIGTYPLAILADYHTIPFYCAAPGSTFDFSLSSGSEIPIEERDYSEILDFWKIKNNFDYSVYNPAFDITPNKLLTGIITEKGIIEKPVSKNMFTF